MVVNGWTIDLDRMEARHISGLLVRFRPAADTPGAWDGEAIGALPASMNETNAARLMREAGDAMMAAIRARPKS
jgi:hypothetical protein